jgi:ribonucleoside-diphosphate reductase alpha chain
LNKSNKILSDITVFNKYAKYLPEMQRRETWEELVTRNKEMHQKKYPHIANEIESAYAYVYNKKVLPSMRSLQFGGRPIEVANNRIYNCAFLPIDDMDAFSELMFLLLGGTGGGYSVQRRWVDKLPTVLGPTSESRRFLVGDSIEGWADAIKVLVESFYRGKQEPAFDFRDIREKGAALITTGGKAPGPEPLKVCLDKLSEKFKSAIGRKLSPLEVHDICCIIADAVLAGGIRRAALISLFDRDDQEMLSCKSGAWWEDAPYRARANNSAVLPRGEVSKEEFYELMKIVEASGAGEPGVYWTSNEEWGTNPCCEIGLRPFQFCNLCELNASDVTDQADLNARARAAALIGTLQAGYTDFHYLRPIWKETTEKDALIGVGMTGIGSGAVLGLNLREAADQVVEENKRVAGLIGVNPAARTTTVKPSGTSSLVVGSSSGIHAWHNNYYIRRMRVGKDEALYHYMLGAMPELVEDDTFNPKGAVLSFPQAAPRGAILRSESPTELLDRVRLFNLDWVRHGHISGDNTHNVSCTISLKDDEWGECVDWMWSNRNEYNGISVLPYDGGSYVQAPFEDITEARYYELESSLTSIDLSQVREDVDNTDLSGEAACAGGSCEITF